MKLDKLFNSESNKLFFLDGAELNAKESVNLNCSECTDVSKVPADSSKLYCISVEWTKVGLDEESYDENFLALFRDYLKECEEKKVFAFVLPVADKMPETDAEKENFTASFKHCARRIKDCTSIVGFAIPECVNAETFVEELFPKHKHYVFFSKNAETLKDASIVEF